MPSANETLRRAAGEIGYSRWDDPAPGTKYGRHWASELGFPYLGTNGVPFCDMGLNWVLDMLGWRPFDGAGIYSVGATLRQARGRGEVIADKRAARPGDLLVFDWDGVRDGDHIGFCEVNCGSYVQTIEFNTSSGRAGSQGNGGGVHRRTRSWSVVSYAIRPRYTGTSSNPAPPGAPDVVQSFGLEVDGYWGRATTLRLQNVLGCPYRDGEVSRQPGMWRGRIPACTTGWEFAGASGAEPGSQTIAAMQRAMGAPADGFIGPRTINALIKRYMGESGATALDGRLDAASITVKAMQRALNAGRF